MGGDDAQKAQLLQALSATDYSTATVAPVPDHFTILNSDGETSGVTRAELVVTQPLRVFAPLIELHDARIIDDTQLSLTAAQPSLLRIPPEPFYCITCILECADGRIVPQVAA